MANGTEDRKKTKKPPMIHKPNSRPNKNETLVLADISRTLDEVNRKVTVTHDAVSDLFATEQKLYDSRASDKKEGEAFRKDIAAFEKKKEHGADNWLQRQVWKVEDTRFIQGAVIPTLKIAGTAAAAVKVGRLTGRGLKAIYHMIKGDPVSATEEAVKAFTDG